MNAGYHPAIGFYIVIFKHENPTTLGNAGYRLATGSLCDQFGTIMLIKKRKIAENEWEELYTK